MGQAQRPAAQDGMPQALKDPPARPLWNWVRRRDLNPQPPCP